MSELAATARRKGARRKAAVPRRVLALLAAGETETVNLMEWLAVDMSALARSVAAQTSFPGVQVALRRAAVEFDGLPLLARLRAAGRALAGSIGDLDNRSFKAMAEHRSDLVRQWACYAVNDETFDLSVAERLERTVPFASDRNMTVREAAWMAFRPHMQVSLEQALKLLEPKSRSKNANVRRFAIEVSRPRSVWGNHIGELKRNPQFAIALLENVRADESRYVQLATGNWLNDASKTQPQWVIALCARWLREENICTRRIVKRGLRSVRRSEPLSEPDFRATDVRRMSLGARGRITC